MSERPQGVTLRPGMEKIVTWALALMVFPCIGGIATPDPFKAWGFLLGVLVSIAAFAIFWFWIEENGWYVYYDVSSTTIPHQVFSTALNGKSVKFESSHIESPLASISYDEIQKVSFSTKSVTLIGIFVTTKRGEFDLGAQFDTAVSHFSKRDLVVMAFLLKQKAPQAHFEPMALYAASGWIPRF